MAWMQSAMLDPHEQTWIFAAFFLAFAIKIPLLPFHTWQPDTYTTSPPAGSMLLAGIMLKMGLFGMVRWMIPVCPEAATAWALPVMILGVAGVLYGSVIAIMQQDLKRLIAWSSIAHVGLIAAGIFSLNPHGMQGAVIQMVSHGINIAGLFIVADIIERRAGTRDISKLGGIASQAPWFAILFMIVLLGSIALPLTNGFVGEFLLLLGIFEVHRVLAALAGLTIIFGAVYMLWMFQRVMLGTPSEQTKVFPDLTTLEKASLIPLVILILWIGVAPGLFLDTSLKDILELIGKVRGMGE
jgi:NADH-quinone oxidoreductase subunit M